MIEKLKILAPLGKPMAYLCILFCLALIIVPVFKSQPIDIEGVVGMLIGGCFWWLLGKWHENEIKK